MQDAGVETLADFLYRFSHDLNLLDLFRHGGPDAVLEQEGAKLRRPEHAEVLRSGNVDDIHAALKREADEDDGGDGSGGGADVELHQHHKFGPCWILVG
ncbi:MAG TPA: hypothetical protein VIU81_11530 [Gaiellaceae bacterium]